MHSSARYDPKVLLSAMAAKPGQGMVPSAGLKGCGRELPKGEGEWTEASRVGIEL